MNYLISPSASWNCLCIRLGAEKMSRTYLDIFFFSLSKIFIEYQYNKIFFICAEGNIFTDKMYWLSQNSLQFFLFATPVTENPDFFYLIVANIFSHIRILAVQGLWKKAYYVWIIMNAWINEWINWMCEKVE